jgi:alkyldihydroxyacetonephosphate synthase
VEALSSLVERLPPGAVLTEGPELAARARDSWTVALLREARGEAPEPAVAVFPSSTDEVAAVMAWAAETGTPVVPRGGGSGVCGGVEAGPNSVLIDLSRMDRLISVDEESHIARVEAGIRGSRLEEALEPYGLTLGHYPQSIEISSVGGWIAASSAGQASAGYGAIEDLLLGATAVLPGGGILRLRAVPRSAAGPDLRRLLVGSEGTFAVITEAFLSCSPRPPGFVWDSFRFGRFETCMEAFRAVVRSGAGAAVLRGYDEVDPALSFGPIGHAGGCVAIVGFVADLPGLEARRQAIRDLSRAAGGNGLGDEYGAHWWQHRNDAVGLYRRIMGPERSFGSGVIVDTVEVAGLWSGLPGLYQQVRSALSAHAEAVGCHVSHVYPSGSSLYFTFLIRGADDGEAEGRYLSAWGDAVARCLESGGTMTHHHGVGRLKAPFLAAELGDVGAGALRRIKEAFDPGGLLNPGVMLT